MWTTIVLVVAAAHVAWGACPSPPTRDDLNVTAYMGTWYEIVDNQQFRQEHEKGLICTRAEYSLNGDGTIKVNNTGYKNVSGVLQQDTAIGTARQVKGGKLQVSFYGPFYGPYWVIDLIGSAQDGYQVAMVFSCTDFLSFEEQDLWVLSRTPQLPSGVTLEQLQSQAEAYGIPWSKLDIQRTLQTCDF